ncbi:glucose-6-phosphate dehydrogenase [Gryllotalpicola protaetiae]|uniref:Glucose-6-phosphate dehydrogenase n=1 Tax=Gryllotalpicola protaetiae TaxID=2419771 RepID=A0A387BNR0_9MICO|nr:glucose-6-phosphate dehydrogenase [Gryllotalpicola protaetiae]AYG03654.1 glucose-6-phosphate dehydrogenase [Gryllotalpicola protaetiae]
MATTKKSAKTEAATLLILGASGDLASRLLMPGLGGLLTVQPDRRVQLIGAGVETYADAAWKDRVTAAMTKGDAKGPAVTDLLKHTSYLTADVTKAADWKQLLAACDSPPAIYFALPPAITAKACDALVGLLPDGARLALEKPFGTDEKSAHALNEKLATLAPEDHVFRVDHFLGTSGVLNILGTRFANRIIEPLLNNIHVASVEIVFDETLGLEGRARYYDHAGALVDMIQSHLLQTLAVAAMEPPAALEATDVRDLKALALRATKLWGDDPATASRRARYTAGTIDGRKLPSYVDEEGVNPANETETLAELKLEVRNNRWAGVPFTLRSGKGLGTNRHEIVFTFKAPAHVPERIRGSDRPNRLRLDLKTLEMTLELDVNGPGDPYTIDNVSLTAALNPGQLPAYGEVLAGVLEGDPMLAVRGDTAEDCWRLVDPVLKAWKAGRVPLEEYPAGSSGPWD